MRFSVRRDLGGYAAGIPALEAVARIEIEKPFVLLCGPNGAGKTALLRMARAAMGLMGERAGEPLGAGMGAPVGVEECGGDLGKLAAFWHRMGGPGVPSEIPGVLDVEALGWRGQRSYLYDSRTDTAMATAGQFGSDMLYHASRIAGQGNRASHGQFLRRGWGEAVAWGLGVEAVPDPYDLGRAPPARRAAFERRCPDGRRPAERWLFLDEPETALDADVLTAGLTALLETAEPGRLRVFCASHAPAFAAGFAAHPSVQVVDLHPGGAWFSVQREALALAADPVRSRALGARVAGDMLRKAAERERAEEAERKAELAKALKGIPAAAGALLDALYAHAGHHADARTEGFGDLVVPRAVESLLNRGLAKEGGFGPRRSCGLTELGIRAGRRRAGSASPAEA